MVKRDDNQHIGDGCDTDEVVGNRELLPVEERVSAGATFAGTRQPESLRRHPMVAELGGQGQAMQAWQTPTTVTSSAPVVTLESSPHSIVTANGGGVKCLTLIGLPMTFSVDIDIVSASRCWANREHQLSG